MLLHTSVDIPPCLFTETKENALKAMSAFVGKLFSLLHFCKIDFGQGTVAQWYESSGFELLRFLPVHE